MDDVGQRFAQFPGEDFTRCLNCLLPCCVLIEAITGGSDSHKARDRMAKDPHSVCTGGCKSWKESDEGTERYLDLKERFEKGRK